MTPGSLQPSAAPTQSSGEPPRARDADRYATFLQTQLDTQPHNVMSHRIGAEQIWIKRAGRPHGSGRYRAMAVLASLLRIDALRPVPHPGGPAAIATEVRRLQELAALGIRVPEVLAVLPHGFAMRDLGEAGRIIDSLGNEIDHATQRGDAATVLALWQQGLDTLRHVHQQGTCLSQAFARNLVRCPDGVMACIDFEDDPAAVLPLALCHVRDALCYVHSTAIYLQHSGALPSARTRWSQWVQGGSDELQNHLRDSIQRMRWVRHLPASRRLGRDLQRVRAAYDLVSG